MKVSDIMGTLYIVGTPIGNLNDISKRSIDTLKEVDYILCEDTRNSIKLLNYFDIKNKLISYHKFNENEKVNSIIKDLKKGKNIALISDAGLPLISDPGEVIVKKAREEGLNIISTGGITAFTTALSISGLKSDIFTFYGFFPRENKDRKKLVNEINNSRVPTHIFYESPKRIIKTLEFIKDNINCKVSVSKELTKLHEKTYYGTIKQVLEKLKSDEKSNQGEYTFIIEKELINDEKKSPISLEALLIDEIIKEKVSLKEAIDLVNNKNENISKKDIYNASLNLKNIDL